MGEVVDFMGNAYRLPLMVVAAQVEVVVRGAGRNGRFPLLHERSEKIVDEGARKIFSEQVPAHCAIVRRI